MALNLLGPEDVNKLKLIYLKFQMSCSKILKKKKNETLLVESFSISKLELIYFYFSPFLLCFPAFLKLLFSGPSPHPDPTPKTYVCQ